MVAPRYEPTLPKLGLDLPYQMAGLTFAFVEDYSHDSDLSDQGAGISLRFESDADIDHADLFEYDWNQAALPPGILSRPALREFFHSQYELQQGLESGYYTSLTYIDQRIITAPSNPTDADSPPGDNPPEPCVEWLAATYMATLPLQDAPLARIAPPDKDPIPGHGQPSWEPPADCSDEDTVLVHVLLTVYGRQFVKLRYTHPDVDHPGPEERCLDFLNQITTLLLNHRVN